ncbi:uncharacterized protein LOC119446092 isoform X2 [Dermacentor silvarum]|uniref:uncharacterized protein LOC119446092 isoform X2 n=1 Tax=Dermacentor silvarum TaxID=543639 RepID=UPI00189B5542|nr:uncharacterized protein LOC119446092 isoform X2 [Dermacentor silvarum]
MEINATFICGLLTALLSVIACSPENKRRDDTSVQRHLPTHQVALPSEKSTPSGLQSRTNVVNEGLEETIARSQFLNSEARDPTENITNAERKKGRNAEKEKKHSVARKLAPYKHQYRTKRFTWRNGSATDSATIERYYTESHERRATRANSSSSSGATGAGKLDRISYLPKAITPAQNISKQPASSQRSRRISQPVSKKLPVTKAIGKWRSTKETFSTDSTNLEDKVPVSSQEESHGVKSAKESTNQTSSNRPLNNKRDTYAASSSIVRVSERKTASSETSRRRKASEETAAKSAVIKVGKKHRKDIAIKESSKGMTSTRMVQRRGCKIPDYPLNQPPTYPLKLQHKSDKSLDISLRGQGTQQHGKNKVNLSIK